MSDGGKGSSRRPSAVSDEQVTDNWAKIFNQALEELTAETERLGLYEDYNKNTRNNLETQEVKK